MQTSGGIYQHHIGTICLSTGDRIKGYAGRITAHLLFDDRHTYPLTPDTELLHSSSTERVGSSQIYLFTGLFELPGKFPYRRSLANAIHTYHQYHIWLMITWQIPVVIIFRIVLSQQICNLLLQDAVQFRCWHIFVTSHTFLDTLNDLQRGIHTYVTGDQHLFQIVQHIIVNLRFTSNGTGEFIKHTRFRFLQSLV